ncbi:hypothetical protein GGR50DRAFT_354 [Xylaria sp. CBS 124048]|nr:hypothetical protein GGR50DRAFT_354 [Xylaria sp. CBS 124048]
MAIFVDLEDKNDTLETPTHHGELPSDREKLQLRQELLAESSVMHTPSGPTANDGEGERAADQVVRENLNRNRMTEALGCYPVITVIVSWLDLNSLDNLSRTCRQIRETLLLYRVSLVMRTLRCYKEQPPLAPEDNELNWHYMTINENYRRRGSCARDLVAECRRCTRPVCRNCVIKPPGPSSFRERHRRLCITCTKAPLAALTTPPLLPDTPIDAPEMQRAICSCQKDTVWLCATCGRNLLGADHDYRSIWRWRNRYGEVLGGTSIGGGLQGVICGREADCLGARDVEQQTDCDAADARENLTSSEFTPLPSLTYGSPFSTPGGSSSERMPSPSSSKWLSWGLRPGYARHEIEGIGGVVKTKLVRMILVGAGVPEWEDEKTKEQILEREASGRRRSWCGWCWRVIPGPRDLQGSSNNSGNNKGKGKGTASRC